MFIGLCVCGLCGYWVGWFLADRVSQALCVVLGECLQGVLVLGWLEVFLVGVGDYRPVAVFFVPAFETLQIESGPLQFGWDFGVCFLVQKVASV